MCKNSDDERPQPREGRVERLHLDGIWADRVDDALAKRRPKDGWPKRGEKPAGDDGTGEPEADD